MQNIQKERKLSKFQPIQKFAIPEKNNQNNSAMKAIEAEDDCSIVLHNFCTLIVLLVMQSLQYAKEGQKKSWA